jgi:hypothetical protein
MDDRGSFAGRGNDGNFSHRHRVQTDSGVYSASSAMGAGGSYHGGKVEGA